ncbi:unnamed protein product [Echinostoma caproni]|uniref:40S ribosomal protein S25 n=1 Tax=Echinostoma caproni TaxID=27848 RepID=A0A183A190_9TREM|nr:unnamed protein product [Echinostoma caproni]
MALAATLSKEEIQQSLKAVIKRSKKKIPAPKYLCTPSSQQIQQKVSTLEEKHTICQQFRKLVCSHGSIPELQHVSASSMKKIYASHSTVADCSPERQKLPTVRCFVVRYLKNKFLEDASHRQFW